MAMSKNRRSVLTTTSTVLVALLLVAASVLVTYVVTQRQPVDQINTADSDVTIAVIGDSYTSGLNNAFTWPSVIADGSSLAISNFAIPGAGYVGGEGESGPFFDQLDRAVAAKSDVIIVFGGINDVGKTPELIQQSATDLLAELVRQAPESRVLVFGPIWHEDPPPEAALVIDRSVAAAAAETKVPYVPLIEMDWLVGEGLIQADEIHPTDEGQIVLARELGPLLQQQLRELGTEN